MHNKLDNMIFNNMKYDTYNKLKKFCCSSLVVSNVTNIMIPIPAISILLGIYSAFASICYCYMTSKNNEFNTLEFVEIKKLYNELIKDYSKLVKTFEFKHPIEIYSMYNYMLYNGYLSNNNFFEYGFGEVTDIFDLLGVNVITGKAVCRHIASMLIDIYEEVGLNSELLSIRTENLTLKLLESLEKELLKLNDSEEKSELQKTISLLKKNINYYEITNNSTKKNWANHAITLSEYDNQCFILDPTNRVMFTKADDFNDESVFKSHIQSDEGNYAKIIKNSVLESFNNNKRNKNIKNILLLPDANIFDNEKIIETTTNLCNNNIDLIDKFYLDNKELYSEIDNSLRKVRKKK